MNDRIKELAEQAGLEFDDDLALEPEPIYYTTQKDLEKFSQLIVRECLAECWYDATPKQIADNIRQIFGVEK
jgi:hypothetical protein